MNISSQIKAVREAAELSQAALARELGVARETVARWESGKYPPSLADLSGVAKATRTRLTIGFEKSGK